MPNSREILMESKNHMLTKVGHGILKRRCVVACQCANKKEKKVKVILDEDFIKQPFLKLYAKLKGNTNEIQTTHADESRTQDFENIDVYVRVDVPYKKT